MNGRFFTPIGMLVLAVIGVQAMTVTGYDPEVNDRFDTGFPSAPDPNPSPLFAGSGLDWSGVGWSTSLPTQGFALLSPKHFLYARHYSPSGSNVSFFGEDEELNTYARGTNSTTSFGWRLNGNYDLAVGRLAGAISPLDSVTSYAVYDGPVGVGDSVLIYGRGPDNLSSGPRVAETSIIWYAPGTILDQNNNVIGEGGFLTSRSEVQLASGDSGSPAFLVKTNPAGEQQLFLLGNHAAIDTTNGWNLHNLLSTQNGSVDAVNTHMVAQGYAVRLVGEVSRDWVGGAGGPTTRNQFNQNNNWAGGNVPDGTMYVRFNAGSTSHPNVDLSNGSFDLRGIYFTEANGSISLQNGTLTIGRGGITNYDTNDAQTISVNTVLNAHQFWDGGGGGLHVQGNIDKNGHLLIFSGSGVHDVSGVISGGGGLAKDGSGTLILRQAQTYGGNTWIHSGTLALQDSGLLPSSTLLLMGQNNTVHFALNGATQSLTGIRDDGGNGIASIDLGSGGALNLTLSAASTYSGTISGGTAGSPALTKNGSSSQTLSGNSDYLGVTRVNHGQLIVASPSALGASGAGNQTIVQGIRGGNLGSLRLAASGTYQEDVILAFSTTGATTGTFTNALVVQSSSHADLAGNLTLERQGSGSGTLSWEILVGTGSHLTLNDVTGLVTGSSSGSGTSSNRLQINNSTGSTTTLDGTISNGTLGGGGISLVLTGEGSRTINSVNSYTGITILANGRTNLATNALTSTNGAFGNASTSILFGSGLSSASSHIALFATADLEVSRNLQVNNNNSSGTTTIGVDGANTAVYSGNVELYRNLRLEAASSQGVARFSGTISQVGGDFGVTTTGSGTIILAGGNSYAGGTTIESGTLRLENAGGLGSGGVLVTSPGTLEIAADVLVGNNILAATGAVVRKIYAEDEALSGLTIHTNTAMGTQASLLGGAPATSGLVANLSFAEGLHFGASDIVQLTGLNGHLFVLQLSFDPLSLPIPGLAVLGWDDQGIWRNAVLGNQGGSNLFVGNIAYNGTTQLGSWGRDLDNNLVWAVLNHNSQFMVISASMIPEPSTWALLLLTGGWLFYRRTRQAKRS
jgi:fibronectin-binding autotransporter adhesin